MNRCSGLVTRWRILALILLFESLKPGKYATQGGIVC